MAEAPPALTTARLVLRPLGLLDAPAIQALFPRWEIVRYLASQVPWPYPPDGALAYLRDMRCRRWRRARPGIGRCAPAAHLAN